MNYMGNSLLFDLLRHLLHRSMPSRKPKAPSPEILPPSPPLPTPALSSTSLRMSYRIARGEQGVLTFEPYKSLLIPLWRFKIPPIAQASSTALASAFDSYVSRGDFVGADMARKFLQMGMTRARRYANHKGGKKYDRSARVVEKDGGERVELERSEGHEGREEKAEAANVFRGVWGRCRSDKTYLKLKEEFLAEQKEWDKAQKKVEKEEGSVKEEEGEIKEESDGG